MEDETLLGMSCTFRYLLYQRVTLVLTVFWGGQGAPLAREPWKAAT